MKLKALMLGLVFTFFLLCACSENTASDMGSMKSTELITDAESDAPAAKAFSAKVLTDGDWARYDENIGENVNITFCENGEYYYCCDCGEPVGNSDVYDKYSVDTASRTVKLSGPDDYSSEISILYADENYLFLSFDGDVVLFENLESDIDDDVHEDAEDYFRDGGYALLSILSYENRVLTVAPYNYDGDAHQSFADRIYEIPADDDITFESISVTIDHYDDEKDYVTVSHYKLDVEDTSEIGESYHTGYVSFGEDGEVKGVVFYGTLEVW